MSSSTHRQPRSTATAGRSAERKQAAERKDRGGADASGDAADQIARGRGMKDGRAIEVTILDRTLKIACKEEEKAQLLRAVEYLDAKMREVKSAAKVLSVERVAIMAALNITHELLTALQASGFDSEAFRRRMKSMADAIDEAMSAQEHLF